MDRESMASSVMTEMVAASEGGSEMSGFSGISGKQARLRMRHSTQSAITRTDLTKPSMPQVREEDEE